MRKQKTYMWVDPAFKKKIKREAIENDCDILSYTRTLAHNEDEWQRLKDEKKRRLIDFKF